MPLPSQERAAARTPQALVAMGPPQGVVVAVGRGHRSFGLPGGLGGEGGSSRWGGSARPTGPERTPRGAVPDLPPACHRHRTSRRSGGAPERVACRPGRATIPAPTNDHPRGNTTEHHPGDVPSLYSGPPATFRTPTPDPRRRPEPPLRTLEGPWTLPLDSAPGLSPGLRPWNPPLQPLAGPVSAWAAGRSPGGCGPRGPGCCPPRYRADALCPGTCRSGRGLGSRSPGRRSVP